MKKSLIVVPALLALFLSGCAAVPYDAPVGGPIDEGSPYYVADGVDYYYAGGRYYYYRGGQTIYVEGLPGGGSYYHGAYATRHYAGAAQHPAYNTYSRNAPNRPVHVQQQHYRTPNQNIRQYNPVQHQHPAPRPAPRGQARVKPQH